MEPRLSSELLAGRRAVVSWVRSLCARWARPRIPPVSMFERLHPKGTRAHAVLCYFRDHGLQVPRKVQTGPDAGDV